MKRKLAEERLSMVAEKRQLLAEKRYTQEEVIKTDNRPQFKAAKFRANYGTAICLMHEKVTLKHRRPKNVAINFVHCKRERQRIVYIYNIYKVGNLISPDEHMTFVKHKIHRSWN